MKREINFKSILVGAALLVSAGMFAQTHDGSNVPGDGSAYGTNWANTGTTHMVEGTTIPLFATPDSYYHPNYDPSAATPVYTLTDGFTWTWTDVSGTLSFSQNGAQDNYVEISAAVGDAGTYPVYVKEFAPVGWGGCAGDSTVVSIEVHPVPSAALNATGTIEGCEGDGVLTTAVEATISGGWEDYRLVWNLEIKTLDNLGADADFIDSDKTTILTVPNTLAEDYTTAAPQSVASNAAAHNIKTVTDFTVINNATTVYTYNLVSINDQASRFGNFIALDGDATDPSTFTYYAIGETLEIIVHPTPTTGPIFHINSNWAN